MNIKQIALGIVLAAFSVLTAYALLEYGYVGFFREVISNLASLTLLVDLLISLTIILVYLGNDASRRGVSAVPYLLLTLAFGSVGPLLYLIRRLGSREVNRELSRPARASNL
jgi:MFS superfamily sulfate permease-like transporter